MAVMTATFFSMNAQENTKTHKLGDIKSIDAGYSYKVYVTEGPSKEVKLVYDKELEDYIRVSYSALSSELVLRMDELPRRLRNDNFSNIKVYVSMDDINAIELSGAASVIFEGKYKASSLAVDLSGASSLSGLMVSADRMSIGSFCGRGAGFDGELSGASDLDADLDFSTCRVNCSGASKAELAGKVERLSADGSGACSIDAKNLVSEYASVDLSGACKAKVNADKELRYDIPRSCKITYYGNAKLVNMSDDNNVVRGN